VGLRHTIAGLAVASSLHARCLNIPEETTHKKNISSNNRIKANIYTK